MAKGTGVEVRPNWFENGLLGRCGGTWGVWLNLGPLPGKPETKRQAWVQEEPRGGRGWRCGWPLTWAVVQRRGQGWRGEQPWGEGAVQRPGVFQNAS